VVCGVAVVCCWLFCAVAAAAAAAAQGAAHRDRASVEVVYGAVGDQVAATVTVHLRGARSPGLVALQAIPGR